MTRHRHRLLAVACVLLIASPAIGAATAQTADSDGGGILSDTIDSVETALTSIYQGVQGYADRIRYAASQAVGESDATASDTVDDLRQYADDGEKEEAILTYANSHIGDDVTKTEYDVLRLDLEAGGESRTVYAVANVTDDEVTDLDIEDTTSRTVDYTLTLDEFATRELPEDVDWVYSTYVAEDKTLDGGAKARFSSKYPGHINVTEGDA